jgi:hypothetical protein
LTGRELRALSSRCLHIDGCIPVHQSCMIHRVTESQAAGCAYIVVIVVILGVIIESTALVDGSSQTFPFIWLEALQVRRERL